MTDVETVKGEDLLERLRQHNGEERHVLAGTPNFGLSVKGIVVADGGRIYIDKKIDGQKERYRMDITDYVRRCEKLDVRAVDQL